MRNDDDASDQLITAQTMIDCSHTRSEGSNLNPRLKDTLDAGLYLHAHPEIEMICRDDFQKELFARQTVEEVLKRSDCERYDGLNHDLTQ
jgi:hypothetical protein